MTLRPAFRVLLIREGSAVVDLYRKYATLVVPKVNGSPRAVLIEYQADDWVGRIRAEVEPSLAV